MDETIITSHTYQFIRRQGFPLPLFLWHSSCVYLTMKKHIYTAVLFMMLLSVTSMKCQKHVQNPDPCADIACTAMFGMINVKVTDSTGNKIILDDAYTVRLDNNDTIRYDQSATFDGSYIILDDNYQKKMVNTSLNFRFVGIKNGKAAANETYTISADCCHINKQSGKSTIIVP